MFGETTAAAEHQPLALISLLRARSSLAISRRAIRSAVLLLDRRLRAGIAGLVSHPFLLLSAAEFTAQLLSQSCPYRPNLPPHVEFTPLHPPGLDFRTGGGEFAASRWYPGSKKRYALADALLVAKDVCAPESTEECSGIVTPDEVVLEDGHLFGLEGVEDDEKEELFVLASEGATAEELPEKFKALEQDVEGVPARLMMMRR